MWKYRRLGVLVAWLVAAATATVIFMMPDRYEASARVYVDTQSILRPLMSGLAVQPNIEQQVTMLSRTLVSLEEGSDPQRFAELARQVDNLKDLIGKLGGSSTAYPYTRFGKRSQ